MRAPAASSTRHIAAVTSGPMPSPGMSTTGVMRPIPPRWKRDVARPKGGREGLFAWGLTWEFAEGRQVGGEEKIGLNNEDCSKGAPGYGTIIVLCSVLPPPRRPRHDV